MEPRCSAGAPHSLKRWQLAGTDYQPAAIDCCPRSGKHLSSWTPLGHKATNKQLFEERVNLLLRWFDLWSDQQRKHLLRHLLAHCTGPQLRLCRDLLMEAVPVTRVDFTSVLPRFLSLYVLSFLNPRDLCSAAQVCWHWRILAEQDCVWASRCIRRGWFLPYTPSEKEFGAWKSHYASCLSSLDWLTPREAACIYGTLNQVSAGPAEEAEERRKERRIREMIREKLQKEKRESLRSRRPWGSSAKLAGVRGDSTQMKGPPYWRMLNSWPLLSSPQRSVGSPTSCPSNERAVSWRQEQVQSPGRRHNHTSLALSPSTCSLVPPTSAHQVHQPCPLLLLLVSNRIPAHELLLSGVKATVLVVLYDHKETLASLLTRTENSLCGRTVQRLGLLALGWTEDVHVLQNSTLSKRTLLTPDHREFWERLSSWVEPGEDAGVDIFSPLGASVSGLALMRTLSTLTGLQVSAPMGFATGSFQNILGEWCDGSLRIGPANLQLAAAPALKFVWDGILQSWCRQAQWIEEALRELRPNLLPRLQGVSLLARGRALGHFLCDKMSVEEQRGTDNAAEALAQGVAALSRHKEEEKSVTLTSQEDACRVPEQPQVLVDWRGALVRELHHSESLYLDRLSAVLKVYQEPLAAALASNRAILSFTDLHVILSPLEQLLELNRQFKADLETRLQAWGSDSCVGDVFVKLCSRLPVYNNYFNNYSTAVHAVDKCRETKPLFRAFLKRVDKTLATHSMSLQELLLCPAWRIQEYVTLLQALQVHTHHNHPDHSHLSSVLEAMLRLRESVHKLKKNSERDELLEETQRQIRGCPTLNEGNRMLIMTQNAVLLRSPDDEIPESLRVFQEVCDLGLFLFSDTLILTRRKVHHKPFSLSRIETHTFLASEVLSCLSARELTHTRYVSHAFVVDGARHSWVCAVPRAEERDYFLSALCSAINSSLTVTVTSPS